MGARWVDMSPLLGSNSGGGNCWCTQLGAAFFLKVVQSIFSVQRLCVRKMLYSDEIYPGGFYVNNVSVQNKQKKNLTSIQTCVFLCSLKPMSYTEIRDRTQVFDIKASLASVVGRKVHASWFFFFLTLLWDLTTVFDLSSWAVQKWSDPFDLSNTMSNTNSYVWCVFVLRFPCIVCSGEVRRIKELS